MKRKLLSLLLAFAVTLSVLPVGVLAADPLSLDFAIDSSTSPFFANDPKNINATDLGKFTVGATSPDIKITGTANYIEDWNSFSSIADEEKGHYIPLKITPSIEGCKLTITTAKPVSKEIDNWPKDGDTLVMRLDSLTNKTFKIKVEKDGANSVEYTIDCTGVQYKDAQIAPDVTFTLPSEGDTLLGKKTSDLFVPAANDAVTVGTPTADNVPVTVKGTAHYVKDYTGFSSDVSDQSGHYLPLRLTLRDGLTAASVQEVELRGATSITFPANKFFTEKNGTLDSETVVMRLDKITTPKQFTIVIKWVDTNKNPTTYTVKFGGVTLEEPAENIPEITFGFPDAEMDLFNKTIADLFTPATNHPVTVGDPTTTVEGSNITVSVNGTAKYVTDYSGFHTNVSDQSGHYLPLQLTLPTGLTAADVGEVELKGKETKKFTSGQFFTESGGTVETIVMRLDELTDQRFTIKINWKDNKIKPTTYTVDCSGVTMEPDPSIPTLSFSLPPETEDLLGKKTNDFFRGPTTGSAITVTGTTVAVTGSALYITGFTAFNETDVAEQKGNYLPLRIVPSLDGCKVTVIGSKTKEFVWPKNGDSLIMRLNFLENKQFTIKVEKDDKSNTYIVDCKGINFGQATKYIVTFETNGGSKVEDQRVESGEKATRPADPSKDGYDFVDWFKGEETNPFDFNTAITENITLKAKWNEKPRPEGQYTITFDKNCEDDTVTINPSSVLTVAGKLESGPIPKRTGYIFDGWYLNKDGSGSRVTFKTIFKKDTPVYAKWSKRGGVDEEEPSDEFTVTFDLQDGSEGMESVSVEKDKTVAKPENPTRDGYSFNGWYKDKEGTEIWDFEKDTVTEDVTIYAKWTKIPTPGDENYEYRVWIRYGSRHGDIYTSHWYAEKGETVTLTVYPDSDYQLEWLEISQESGGLVNWERDGREYTFTMPASNVTVDAGFDLRTVHYSSATDWTTSEPSKKPAVVPVFTPLDQRPATAMSDVAWGSWAYSSAQWAYQNGYLDMAYDGTFRLDDPVSHQQMWKIMAQWLGEPAATEREIASWACKIGAGKGSSPTGAMTRQDVVAYLYQCYFLMGGDVSTTGNLAAYADSRLIAPASQKAWLWAVEKGIVTGTAGGNLNPGKMLSRGEFAAMLMRLCQKLMG